MLFYSWADVMAYDRFADATTTPTSRPRLRSQAREMFRLAEASGCRHQNLVGYFQQQIEACNESCDRCTDTSVKRVVERRPGAGPNAIEIEIALSHPANRVPKSKVPTPSYSRA